MAAFFELGTRMSSPRQGINSLIAALKPENNVRLCVFVVFCTSNSNTVVV